MMGKTVLHHCQDVEWRVGEELKPLPTPVSYSEEKTLQYKKFLFGGEGTLPIFGSFHVTFHENFAKNGTLKV